MSDVEHQPVAGVGLDAVIVILRVVGVAAAAGGVAGAASTGLTGAERAAWVLAGLSGFALLWAVAIGLVFLSAIHDRLLEVSDNLGDLVDAGS